MERIEQLKAILPKIPDVVTGLEKESGNSLKGPCPKCGGKDRFVYKTDTRRFWCRQCNEQGGDVIDFHIWLNNTTTGDLFSQYLPKDDQEGNQGRSMTAQWKSILTQYTNKAPVYRLFTGRKISEATIDKAFLEGKIRFFKHRGKDSVACAYTELNGIKNVLAIQCLSVDGIVFPFADENKVFLKDSKAGENCFFQIGTAIKKAKTIILCEAVIDALSCADCLPEACVLAIGGTSLSKKVKALRPHRDSGKTIICFFDNDEAGRKATQAVARVLGVKTVAVQWSKDASDGCDVNDLLKNDEHKTIIEMVKNTKTIKIKKKSQTSKEEKKWEYHFTDLGNAERLVNLYGQDLRYCYPFKRWLVWDGKRWNGDNMGQLRKMCKDTIKQIYQEALKLDDFEARKALMEYALRCENVKRQRDMAEFTQSEDGIPILPEHLDKDIYLINCLNGTVDLRTGKLSPHRRDDLITKLVPANYNSDAKCPVWLAHLNKIMAGNDNLIQFLQKAFGYSLTGDTSERIIFFQWGSGANGKSVTNDAIAMIMGDYAMRTPTETLLLKRNDGIPSDIARLKGARFVYASEVEQGKRLAESLIKDISGGDKISARFLHQEWFEFYPEFKLWLGTNHKPIIRGTDKAIWDRIRLIPFIVRIPENEKIPKTELFEKFEGEKDGIFSWLVAGCLKWQKEGLGMPKEVKAAITEYRNEMDVLGDFVEDRCITGESIQVKVKDIYNEYEGWAEANGEKPLSKKIFGIKLDEKGFDVYRGSRGVRFRVGIGIKQEV